MESEKQIDRGKLFIHNDIGVIGVINNGATELHRAKNIKKYGLKAARRAPQFSKR